MGGTCTRAVALPEQSLTLASCNVVAVLKISRL